MNKNMNKIVIDEKKCIGCGICTTDCIRSILDVKDKKAYLTRNSCLGCGHCIAVCPTNAISLENLDMSEVVELKENEPNIDPEQFLLSIKASRSVRLFKDDKVSKDIIEQIIEAGRFTATAQNKQDVSFVVVEDLDKIKEIEQITLDDYNRLKTVKDENGNYVLGKYRRAKFEEGFLFKNSPLLIMTKSDHTVNAALATKSMELMAEYLGLGAFHVGLFTVRVDHIEELKELFNIEGEEEIVTCLALGYPDIEYRRTVPREKPVIQWL